MPARMNIAAVHSFVAQKGGRCHAKSYINAKTPLPIECTQGHQWKATWDSISHGSWCRKCHQQKRASMPRVPQGKRSLASTHPALVKEWFSERNLPLKPTDVTSGSGRKVWWQCKKRSQHLWPATIASRTSGRGCPFCANLRVDSWNCLAATNPSLAAEWHPTKNGKLTPKDVVAFARRTVWWQCSLDDSHEWQAAVYARSAGQGCGDCVSSTSEPELRLLCELRWIFGHVEHRSKAFGREVDILIPDVKIGIEVDGYYWHKDKFRQDRNKTKLLSSNGINLIRLREAGLSKLTPQDLKLPRGKLSFQSVILVLHQIRRLATLPKRIRKRFATYTRMGRFQNEALYGELAHNRARPLPGQSLKDRYPKIANEWHPKKNGKTTPAHVHPGSSRSAHWLCSRGHEWNTTISHRTGGGTGCPDCLGRRLGPDNSLAKRRPDLASLWHPTKNGKLTPSDVTARRNIKVWWICPKFGQKHVYPRLIANMAKKPSCSICNNRFVSAENSLASLQPDLAKQWHPTKNKPLTPHDVTPGSHRYVWWRCPANQRHVWDAPPINRKQSPHCPFCTHRRIHPTESLAAIYPKVAREWHPTKNRSLQPNAIGPRSGRRVWWKCRRNPNHSWHAIVQNRTAKGQGCPKCRIKEAR